MDVFIDRRKRVWIVDFNPFGATTDSLLFDWSELIEHDNTDDTIDFLIVETQAGVRPAPEGFQRVPADLAGLATAQDLDEFISQVQKMDPTNYQDPPRR